jgi:hypothetical protein
MPYRFAFGGHENDNEVKGTGNHLSFGDYGYDTRLGRRWNRDPQFYRSAGFSPYSVFGDNPIYFADPDGNFKVPVHQRIIRNAAKKLGYDEQRIKKLENGVAYTDAASDAGLADHSSYLHFDGLDNSRQVRNNYTRIQGDLTRIKNSNSATDFHVGFYIHAIQDFYAHSNYAELHTQYFGADANLVTYKDVLNDKTGKYTDFKSLLDKNLITGKFNLVAEVAKGTLGDSGAEKFLNFFGIDYKKTHAYLNKDEANTKSGQLAEKLAEQETETILKETNK